MSLLHTIAFQPQRLAVRRLLFQIHLWAGIFLALYLTVIGTTGAILVFEQELGAVAWRGQSEGAVHGLDEVVAAGRSLAAGKSLSYVGYPTPGQQVYRFWYEDAGGRSSSRVVSAGSLKPVISRGDGALQWVEKLHTELFLGSKGLLINGLAASGLMVMAATGVVLWWPGVRRWREALRIRLRVGWRRMHFDVHSAAGFWAMPFIFWWALSGIYFCWPMQVAGLIDHSLGLQAMKMPPQAVDRGAAIAGLKLESLLERARLGTPGGSVSGVSLPAEAGGVVTVYVDRGRVGDFSQRDIYSFSGRSGEQLSVWHYGEKKTAGDWLLWLMHPLHFGSLWGVGVQCLWALMGLMLPVLSWTGLVMYWNRWLGKKLMRR